MGNEKKERKPVVLSKNEALYPPSKRSLIIAGVCAAILVVLIILSFIFIPLG